MEQSIIDSIKNHNDKDEVITLFEGGIVVLTEELKAILSSMKDVDKDFVIELLEMQINSLNADLKDIAKYLKNKYGEYKGNNEDSGLLMKILCEPKEETPIPL